jgi:hypothetical protein
MYSLDSVDCVLTSENRCLIHGRDRGHSVRHTLHACSRVHVYRDIAAGRREARNLPQLVPRFRMRGAELYDLTYVFVARYFH